MGRADWQHDSRAGRLAPLRFSRISNLRAICVLLASAWLLNPLNTPASAESPPPSSATPALGDLIQTLRQDPRSPLTHPQAEKPASLAAPVEAPVSQSDTVTPEASPITEDTPFFVQSVSVEGVSALNRKELARRLAPFQESNVTFRQLKALADSLTALYHEQGFVTSQVVLPPQTLEGHSVQLQAIEGRLGDVQLEMDPAHPLVGRRAIAPRLNLDRNDIFNLRAIRSQLNTINEHPDMKVGATIRASQTPGATDLTLTAKTRFPLHISPSLDNMGRETIGDLRVGLTAQDTNLLGFGDQLSSSLVWTRRSFGHFSRYRLPVGAYGAEVGFDFGRSALRLGNNLTKYEISGHSTTYSINLTQPLYRGDWLKITGSQSLDIKNMETALHNQPLYADNIRVWQSGLDIEQWDRLGRTILHQEIGVGLPIFRATDGGSRMASRRNAGSRFFRYAGQLMRIHRLPLKAIAVLRLNYQVSPDRLVSSEQMQLGGAYSVRGYREGSQIGDAGLSFNAEYYLPLSAFLGRAQTTGGANGETILRPPHPLADAIQLVAFSDFGASWTNRPLANGDKSEYMAASGLGVRARLSERLTGRLDLALPLLRYRLDSQRLRVHFGLQSALF